MKWSKFNILFYLEKLGYCLFNSRMLSFVKLDKYTYDFLISLKNSPELAENKLCTSDYHLYRVGYIEKNIPYNVCQINDKGLIKYLETYSEP